MAVPGIAITFEHEGHKVFFKMKRLTETDLVNLDGHVGDEVKGTRNYAPHIARYLALQLAVEKKNIKIDDEWYKVEQGAKKTPPPVYDQFGHSTLDHALGYVIHYNPALIEQDKYREAFEEYTLEEEDVPDEDPTPFPRSVGTG